MQIKYPNHCISQKSATRRLTFFFIKCWFVGLAYRYLITVIGISVLQWTVLNIQFTSTVLNVLIQIPTSVFFYYWRHLYNHYYSNESTFSFQFLIDGFLSPNGWLFMREDGFTQNKNISGVIWKYLWLITVSVSSDLFQSLPVCFWFCRRRAVSTA